VRACSFNPSFSLAQYESFMVAQAQAYYSWGVNDLFQRIAGLNPWYWLPYSNATGGLPNPATGWYYEVATTNMPAVDAAWLAIGAEILRGPNATAPGEAAARLGFDPTPAPAPGPARMAELAAISEAIRANPHAFTKPVNPWAARFGLREPAEWQEARQRGWQKQPQQ
jgi:hypothetical protein